MRLREGAERFDRARERLGVRVGRHDEGRRRGGDALVDVRADPEGMLVVDDLHALGERVRAAAVCHQDKLAHLRQERLERCCRVVVTRCPDDQRVDVHAASSR